MPAADLRYPIDVLVARSDRTRRSLEAIRSATAGVSGIGHIRPNTRQDLGDAEKIRI
jgi:hypothetical protein